MQIASKMKPLLVTSGLFLIWKFASLSEILLRFSKNPKFVQTYGMFFFPLCKNRILGNYWSMSKPYTGYVNVVMGKVRHPF